MFFAFVKPQSRSQGTGYVGYTLIYEIVRTYWMSVYEIVRTYVRQLVCIRPAGFGLVVLFAFLDMSSGLRKVSQSIYREQPSYCYA